MCQRYRLSTCDLDLGGDVGVLTYVGLSSGMYIYRIGIRHLGSVATLWWSAVAVADREVIFPSAACLPSRVECGSDRVTLWSTRSQEVRLSLIFSTVVLCVCGCASTYACATRSDINLVDPASSHMLVSKIKPCMSQYKLLYGETANGSLKQL